MSQNPNSIAPAEGILSITPNDSADLSKVIRAFQVGTAGDLAVIMLDGTSGVIPGCIVGVQYAGYSIKRILATGSTANGIVGFY